MPANWPLTSLITSIKDRLGALTSPAAGSVNERLGTDGATPPAITGTGIRGWLRAIYERLTAGIGVTGSVEISNDSGNALSVDSASANAALGAPADAPAAGTTDGTIVALLKRLRTLLNGGLPAALTGAGNLKTAVQEALPTGTNSIGTVDLSAANPTTIIDAATVAASKYIGVTVANMSTTATARVRVRNQNVSGVILDTLPLAQSEALSYTYPRGRAAASGTVYIEVASGTVEGSVFTA